MRDEIQVLSALSAEPRGDVTASRDIPGEDNPSRQFSRRDLLKGGVLAAAGLTAAGAFAACSPNSSAPATLAPIGTPAEDRVTTELPIPNTYDPDRPDANEYEVDALVIGGGYAGLNAAYTLKQAGKNVMILDKGRPGFSGQSPWPGTFNYFDPDIDGDKTAYLETVRYGSEYLGNLDWINVWIEESKPMKERIESWGVLDMYPQMFETEYWETRDHYGYRDNIVGSHFRQPKMVEMLDNNGIPWLQHVMVTNIVVQGGKCVGAVGFQFTTGEYITVHAKAVILAAGNGCIIPTGHPIGNNTFDSEWMAYQLGLGISGKEFEDFHSHNSFAPGCNWIGSDSRFFDPNFLCGGPVTIDNVKTAKEACDSNNPKNPTYPDGLPYIDTMPLSMEKPSKISAQSSVYGTNPDEVRIGKAITPYVRMEGPVGATGMCLHLASGVFCGLDDLEGYTGIPGLWVAGDGTQWTSPDGANYSMAGSSNGFTSCFCSICGDHAGKAAAAYSDTISLEKISAENYGKAIEEIEQPLNNLYGYSPMWARDVLQGIMGPFWIMRNKSEEMLSAALTQVMYMKENVSDNLLARNGHYLRLCHEVKHKIQASELKLRAALARKESRGANFFRLDYPSRNDDEYLGYFVQKKGSGKEPEMTFVPAKKEWTAAGIPTDYKLD